MVINIILVFQFACLFKNPKCALAIPYRKELLTLLAQPLAKRGGIQVRTLFDSQAINGLYGMVKLNLPKLLARLQLEVS